MVSHLRQVNQNYKNVCSPIQWLLDNKHAFQLQLIEYTWPQTYSLNTFDIEIIGIFQGRIISGRATDTDKDIALQKAMSEWFERLVQVNHQFKTSSGMAAHSLIDHAVFNARKEWIERFSFLNIWRSKMYSQCFCYLPLLLCY